MRPDLPCPGCAGHGKHHEQRRAYHRDARPLRRPVGPQDDAAPRPPPGRQVQRRPWLPQPGRLRSGQSPLQGRQEYCEPTLAGIILTGKRAPYHFDPKPEECDFFDLKGIVENFLNGLLHRRHYIRGLPSAQLPSGKTGQNQKRDAVIGVLGEVHPEHVARLDVPQRIFFAELNLNELLPLLPKQLRVTDLAQFPGSERDWTLTLNEETPDRRGLKRHSKASPPASLKKSCF